MQCRLPLTVLCPDLLLQPDICADILARSRDFQDLNACCCARLQIDCQRLLAKWADRVGMTIGYTGYLTLLSLFIIEVMEI